MHLAKIDVSLYLTRKREAKAFRRQKLAKLKRLGRIRAHLHRIGKQGVFGSQSQIAQMLSTSALGELPMPQTSLHLQVPREFSMLDNPENVLELVSAFAMTHLNKNISDVFVDFGNIVSQDLGAHALLDKLVDELVAQTAFRSGRIAWKGNFPAKAAQSRFVRAMGIIRQLGLTKRYLDMHDANKIHLFERKCRHYIRSLRKAKPEDKTEQANAAQRFIDHINKCLSREGRHLTPAGAAKLCSYVVEIIDNAENHAGMVDWTIQGYVDMALDEPECEIVIFNFGKSISESLDELPKDGYTMTTQVHPYLELHSKNGWLSHRWRREDLLTLIALQGSVSSRNASILDTRGQGTADLIEAFQTINDERSVESGLSATMYIVSGSTRILFNPKYRLHRGEDGSRRIAFNVDNDLSKPPDPSCVMPLQRGQRLPGTMIGIKFKVGSAILQQADSGEHP